MYFENRQHAGQLLAAKLQHFKTDKPILMALPRGGVPVGAEIAKSFQIPLHILVVRKIGSPINSELAVGALCEESGPIFTNVLSQLGLNPDDVQSTVELESKEVLRQVKEFRSGNPPPLLSKRVVILVDDGLATGATMSAAIQCLEKKGCKKIIVAVPVAATLMAQSLRKKIHEVVTIEERDDLWSVSQWYTDFSQVSDQDVKKILSETQEYHAHLNHEAYLQHKEHSNREAFASSEKTNNRLSP